ncbi:glycosyltransferase family 4 protein [Cobetia sp. MMG027]|uniref:glycosyltransferase family 4 protein n=1 Tax=Cobetia sp. MMG027 TaxID=3021980 RepID=UPI0022FE31E1|nr:glycosyltransferase family 4 protein [Cobetia sp. MMG027]MDA5565374.1 glycosyltransferase family 4 protein [Cobetia sp. MMG027]
MYPNQKNPSFGIFVKNIVTELSYRGSEVDVCCLQPYKIKSYSYIKFIFKFILMIRRSNYDLVYTHFTSHTFFVHLFKAFSKKKLKFICHSHGSDVVTKANSFKYRLSKFNMKKSDVLVFPSDKFRDHILSQYRIYDKKVIVYPSGGINKDFYVSVDPKYKIKTIRNYGYVGRIISEKGIFDLITCFEKLKSIHEDVTLSIAGDGPGMTKLMEYISKHEIKNVVFHGVIQQSKIPKFLETIDCLVFPTKYEYESLGLVGLEAFASCNLLIVSDVLGPSSYANKNNSLIYELNGKNNLYDAMLKAYSMSQGELIPLINNARKTVDRYTSLEVNNLFHKEIEEYVFYSRW